MKNAILLILMSLFPACSHDSPPEHCRIAGRIMTKFVDDVKKKYKFDCCMTGGEFLNRVNGVNFGFVDLGPKSIEELRVSIVILVEDFLNRINSDEEIRSYLSNYPFTPNNLEFQISLQNRDGKRIRNIGSKREQLYGALLMNGKLIYSFSNDDEVYLQDAYRETYEEALEIVKKQRPDLFSESKQAAKIDIKVHYTNEHLLEDIS